MNKVIFEALMKLEPTLRLPIHLFYFGDYSYKEIAKILDLSESAVAMRIKRGKEQLRGLLEE
jgi:RNA polymerase sigma-70 factor (ECF subfamily)